MAFIDARSRECTVSQLDLFKVPGTQTAVEASIYSECQPVNTISENTPIEFNLVGTGDEYIDINSTILFLRAQLLKGDGDPIDDTDQVGPVNLFMHSLFSQVDIKLNETLISDTNNTYPYRAYLETLLSYGGATKGSQLSSSIYYKDVAGHMDERNPLLANGRNTGLRARHALFNDGRVVDMAGRIHSDIFFQSKYLPNEVNVRIRLIRNRENFCLMASENNAEFKIKIHDCKLLIRKVRINPSTALGLEAVWKRNTAKFPLRRVMCKTVNIAAGQRDFHKQAVFAGPMPSRLVIAFVDNDALNGSFAKNPFNFKNYSLTTLQVDKDGQKSNVRPIETNFEARNYIQAYQSLFWGTNKMFCDEDLDIKREDFPDGYAIYAFDLTNDLNPNDDNFSLLKNGCINIHGRFGVALPNSINLVILGELESILEIDNLRNVRLTP